MKDIIIIPARLGSSRFPGKPMKKIVDIPMIGHCYFRSKLATGFDAVYVATCDQEIADYIESIGGISVMTSKGHNRASTRTAEALDIIEKEINEEIGVVVMVQGDEPLISPKTISNTLKCFLDKSVDVVNIMSKCQSELVFKDKNNVKVVVNKNNDAMYFSREPIPSPWKGWKEGSSFMQTGVIAFRRESLYRFNRLEEKMLEQVESVDMNRILEDGGKIRMLLTDSFTIGVDTEEELKLVDNIMKKDKVIVSYSKESVV